MDTARAVNPQPARIRLDPQITVVLFQVRAGGPISIHIQISLIPTALYLPLDRAVRTTNLCSQLRQFPAKRDLALCADIRPIDCRAHPRLSNSLPARHQPFI